MKGLINRAFNMPRRSQLRLVLSILLAVLVVIGERYFRDDKPGSANVGQGGGLTASGRARLVDGDSLFVDGRGVRMVGIDAPEGPQTCQRGGRSWRCGDASRDKLASLIRNREVTCKGAKEDRFGRLLGTCYVGDLNLNREMVLRGFALSYGRYGAQQRQAKRTHDGLWGKDVTFQNPKAWRRQNGRG